MTGAWDRGRGHVITFTDLFAGAGGSSTGAAQVPGRDANGRLWARTLTYGALFAGYGGLELGAQQALGGRTLWHAEIEDAPSRILAHHWPDVPNLGDVTTVDWTGVPHVDVITGGSPCQDMSVAGRRAGMRPGTRSGLWSAMARAIDTIRPRLVIWENVRGALSAAADSGMEPCPGCVGDPDGGPVLRALGRVLGDLADLGFDAAWSSLPAAEVGAAHLRWRVFLLAWQRGDDLMDLQVRPPTCPPGLLSGRTLLPTPTSNLGDNGGTQHPDKRRAGGHSVSIADAVHGLALLPTPAAQRSGRNKSQSVGASVRPSLDSIATLLPTPRASDGVKGGPNQRGSAGDLSLPAAVQAERWGEYAAAVARHEMAIGRAAPNPTHPPRRPAGKPQLSPEFVEWLMMLPAGHVTGVPHLTRTQQLKALGNGVVPAQAAEGIARCLAIVRAGAAGRSAAA